MDSKFVLPSHGGGDAVTAEGVAAAALHRVVQHIQANAAVQMLRDLCTRINVTSQSVSQPVSQSVSE